MTQIYNILNLGAGVQSSTLLLLMCRGDLPKADHAIFADTQWEPKAVYEHLQWLKKKAADADIPLHVVTHGNIKQDALRSQVRGVASDGHRWASMPFYTLEPGAEREGMIRRQCTSEYKLLPITRWLRRDLLQLKPKQRIPKDVIVRSWMGITTDEIQRVKPAREPWRESVFPFCGIGYDMGKTWTRTMCINWLERYYPDRIVPRSACIGCPFHDDTEWRHLRNQSPAEFAEACEFDDAIRNCGGMRGQIFLHRKCKPLRDIDFNNDVDQGQGVFWNNECEGMCGV